MIARFATLAFLLPLVVACGAETAVPGDSEPARGSRADYVSDGLPEPFGEGDVLRLTLTQDTISFQATCNTFSGNLNRDDVSVLRVSNLGGTEMGCPGPGHEQDEWLVDFFSGEPTVQVDGTDLAVRRGDIAIRFVPAGEGGTGEEPAVPLQGTAWTLAGVEETDGDAIGLSVIPPTVDAGVRIEGGKLLVRTGCNRGSASVTVGEHHLELGPLALTKMACAGAAGDAERGVLQVLDRREVEWGITGTQLRLTYGDRALILDAE